METSVLSPSARIRSEPLSYEEYLSLADESRIIEWADGEVLYHIPPTPVHQSIALYLGSLIQLFVEHLKAGSVLIAPIEVRLWPDGPSREPDMLFIANDKLSQLGERRFDGAPDLVIEVISPTSVTLDRITKFREYEQAGVREYWLIDPRPFQQQADFYIRDDEGHFVPSPIDDEGIYASPTLPGFRFNVAWLWQTPLPNPQRALAWMLADAPGLSDELRAAYRELLRLLPS